MLYPFKNLERIYLHRDYADFRKGVNGLIEQLLAIDNLDVQSSSLFVFCNKKRNSIKAIYWDKTGFCLWHKRLEKATYKWPKKHTMTCIELNHDMFQLFLKGVDISKVSTHKGIQNLVI